MSSSSISSASLLGPKNHLNFQQSHIKHLPVLCARNNNNRSTRRNRFGFGRSSRLVIESACIIASKLGVLPAPLELILRDQFGSGSGSGSGSGNGFGGFGWNGGFFDGGRRRKRGMKLGLLGVCVLACGVGLGFVVGKEIGIDRDVLFGGLGLILFGVSVDCWRNGAKDWVLGFSCCAFLMGLVLKRDQFPAWLRSLGDLDFKKNGRRRRTTRRKSRLF